MIFYFSKHQESFHHAEEIELISSKKTLISILKVNFLFLLTLSRLVLTKCELKIFHSLLTVSCILINITTLFLFKIGWLCCRPKVWVGQYSYMINIEYLMTRGQIKYISLSMMKVINDRAKKR